MANPWLSALASLIPAGYQAGKETYQQDQNSQNQLANKVSEMGGAASLASLLKKQNPGMNIDAGPVKIDNPMGSVRAQMQDVAMQEKLGDKRTKAMPAVEAAKEIENVTNPDGQGGVLTNPNAKLKSAGTVSALFGPKGVAAGETLTTPIAGLAKLIGGPKAEAWVNEHGLAPGSSEEAKALERFQNAATSSLTGGGQSTDAARDAVNTMMGNLASSDTNLRAKGAQAGAKMVKSAWNATSAGFQPHVVQEYNKRAYGSADADPTAFLNRVPDTTIANQQRLASQNAAPPQPQNQTATAAPSPGLSPAEQAELATLRAKHKKSH